MKSDQSVTVLAFLLVVIAINSVDSNCNLLNKAMVLFYYHRHPPTPPTPPPPHKDGRFAGVVYKVTF